MLTPSASARPWPSEAEALFAGRSAFPLPEEEDEEQDGKYDEADEADEEWVEQHCRDSADMARKGAGLHTWPAGFHLHEWLAALSMSPRDPWSVVPSNGPSPVLRHMDRTSQPELVGPTLPFDESDVSDVCVVTMDDSIAPDATDAGFGIRFI